MLYNKRPASIDTRLEDCIGEVQCPDCRISDMELKTTIKKLTPRQHTSTK